MKLRLSACPGLQYYRLDTSGSTFLLLSYVHHVSSSNMFITAPVTSSDRHEPLQPLCKLTTTRSRANKKHMKLQPDIVKHPIHWLSIKERANDTLAL
jgi:hypothetical protein